MMPADEALMEGEEVRLALLLVIEKMAGVLEKMAGVLDYHLVCLLEIESVFSSMCACVN